MTFIEVVNKVKKEFGDADVSNYQDTLALQINITGDGSGAFYTKIENGSLEIEGYDYVDNNAVLTASADDIVEIFSGKLDMQKAVEEGKLSIEGDYSKALSIQPQIDNNKKKPVKKTAAKKTEAKAETKTASKAATTKKATAKTTVKAEAKTAAKAVKETAKTAAAVKSTKATKTAKKG